MLVDVLHESRPPSAFVEPATPAERRMAKLWTAVLNRSAVASDDSFFELGGNSLRATQLVAQINSEFKAEISMNQLYEHPTVAELALLVSPPAT